MERIATRIDNPAHLYPLYCLLFMVSGIPAIYYGSEFGVQGVKSMRGDWSLRPALNLHQLRKKSPQLLFDPRHITSC
jgi:cyclomaltodextrinase / maltogenic alpha-amylase / neopullulanase